MTIPDKFLWGGSISAAQCEGGWDEGGKSPVQVDFGDPGSTTDRRWIHYINADGTFDMNHDNEEKRYVCSTDYDSLYSECIGSKSDNYTIKEVK